MKTLFENIKKKYKIYLLIALGPAAAVTTSVLYIVNNYSHSTSDDNGGWGPPALPPKSNSIFNNIDNINFDKTIDFYNYYISNGRKLGFDKPVFEAFFMKVVLYRLNVNSGKLEFYFHFPTNRKVNIKIIYKNGLKTEQIFKEYVLK